MNGSTNVSILRFGPLSSLAAAAILAASASSGCGKPSAPEAAAKPAAKDDHGHDHGHDHASGDDHADEPGHHHGETTQLGEQKAGPFSVRASRDGDVKAGGDVPIDVWVDGGKAGRAVRFWIGTEDAKGSIKAKAEIEVDHWHTHAEVPDPLPEGSKLWIEIEGDDGAKTVVGFDLKG